MQRRQVGIVGAGPVGLLSALGLARSGIDCVLIEREAGVADSPRAIAHHWSTLPGLDALGILDTCVARGFKKNDFALKVHKTGEELRWTLDVLAGRVKFPYTLYLPQHTLGQVILEALAEYPNVEILWNTELTSHHQDDEGVTLQLDSKETGPSELRVDWLIGTDGARSSVRKMVGLDFEGFTWDQQIIATNIRIDLESYGYARSLLLADDQYGAVIAKIDNENLWRCAFSMPSSASSDNMLDSIAKTLPHILPEVVNGYRLEHHSVYRVHQRAATEFRSGRVLLAGDAAHATNPAGGFGLTTGFMDVFVLYEALAAVVKGTASPEVLDAYARERRNVFLNYTSPQATRLMKLIFAAEGLEEGMERFRSIATDETARLKYSAFAANLETPSLITGARLNLPIAV
jgi:2-polyprenyl-6-methoxyphenol hydroxylase-like FAD-dependent oxidoreductase